MIFLTILGVTEILYSPRLLLEQKIGKEITGSSRLEFLGKFWANIFALPDAEDSTSGLLNRGGIADLSLLRALLTIHKTSWEPRFWEVMDNELWQQHKQLKTMEMSEAWPDTYD